MRDNNLHILRHRLEMDLSDISFLLSRSAAGDMKLLKLRLASFKRHSAAVCRLVRNARYYALRRVDNAVRSRRVDNAA